MHCTRACSKAGHHPPVSGNVHAGRVGANAAISNVLSARRAVCVDRLYSAKSSQLKLDLMSFTYCGPCRSTGRISQ
jgi:hypothetical protein